jgi:hypothetical protein
VWINLTGRRLRRTTCYAQIGLARRVWRMHDPTTSVVRWQTVARAGSNMRIMRIFFLYPTVCAPAIQMLHVPGDFAYVSYANMLRKR